MHSIKNLSNNKIKEIQKLHQKKYRDEKNLFIAEGKKALEEIQQAGIEIVETYTLDNISESEMKKISTTASACDVLTIAKKKSYPLSELAKKNKIILLDSVSDPGNLGTIIRSAAAFGVEGIILFSDCVELYSPKVIRSAAGNFFKTPIAPVKDIEEFKKLFVNHTKIATALSKENNIDLKDAAKIDKYVIMFGSEASGLRSELINIADKNIVIGMKKNVESLNLSVSASIILYELFIN